MSFLSNIKKAAKSVSKSPVTKALGHAVAPIAKAQQAVARKADTALRAVHLTTIAEQLNVHKAITDPKGYLESVGKSAVKDAVFAGQVYAKIQTGDFGGLATEAAKDVVTALGGSKDLAEKAGAIAGTIGAAVAKSKGLAPVTPQGAQVSSVSQLTGEPPLPKDGSEEETPQETATPMPSVVESKATKTETHRGLLIAAAVGAAILLLLATAK